MIKLVGIDVDGTLLRSDGQVPDDAWPLFEQLRARGVQLVLASGRPAFGLSRQLAERLQPGGWHVFQNGASVMQLREGGQRLSAVLPKAEVARWWAEAQALQIPLELYADDHFVVSEHDERARRHAELLHVPMPAFSAGPLEAPCVRVQWLLAHDQLEAARARAPREFSVASSTALGMPDTAFLAITAAGVDKGSALGRLAHELDLARGAMAFLGDGLNDLEAMAAVEYGVAMGNAEPAVKARAKHVVAHVDAGGLCEALRWLLARV